MRVRSRGLLRSHFYLAFAAFAVGWFAIGTALGQLSPEPADHPFKSKLKGMSYVDIKLKDGKFQIRNVKEEDLKHPGPESTVRYVAKDFVRVWSIHRTKDGQVDINRIRRERWIPFSSIGEVVE